MRVTYPLTPQVAKAFKEVRNYAVKCFLNRVFEIILNLVLLQLVQACRYEEFEITPNRGIQTGLNVLLMETLTTAHRVLQAP